MKTFITRSNEKVTFLGAVFATREEAEKHSEAVTFVHDCYASLMGYPCGGFIPLDSRGGAKEVETVAH